MAIAPGCDGVRGAVTMGYLALILGYVYRFSVRARVAAVLGAVALGYVFNLIRLCVLVSVLPGWRLPFPSLQAHGEGADYVIGGLLFLFAASLFAAVVRWKRRDDKIAGENNSVSPPASHFEAVSKSLGWRGATVAVLAVIGSFRLCRAHGEGRREGQEIFF